MIVLQSAKSCPTGRRFRRRDSPALQFVQVFAAAVIKVEGSRKRRKAPRFPASYKATLRSRKRG